MKYRVIQCSLLITLASVFVISAKPDLKQPVKARAFAKKMIDRDDGRSSYNKVLLISCNFSMKAKKRRCSSRPRKKSFESVSKDIGKGKKDTAGLSILIKPASEKGVAFLQKDYDDYNKDTDQWIYLPALKRLKRIVSQSSNSPKKGAFFGSELAYEDMEKIHLNDYYYSYIGDEKIEGRDSWVLEMFPTRKRAPKTSYRKSKTWIDKVSYISLKTEFYNKKSQLAKTMFNRNLTKVKGIWFARQIIIVNHKNHRMSAMQYKSIAVNIPVPESLLKTRSITDAAFRAVKMKAIRAAAK